MGGVKVGRGGQGRGEAGEARRGERKGKVVPSMLETR